MGRCHVVLGCYGQGWEFTHRFFEQINCFLCAKKAKERFAREKAKQQFAWKQKANCSHHSYVMSEGENRSRLLLFKEQQEGCTPGCSFVKNNKFELLLSLFKKEQVSAEWREQFALGHKNEENQWKTVKNIWTILGFL